MLVKNRGDVKEKSSGVKDFSYPLYLALGRLFWVRRALASALTCLILALVILIPLFSLLTIIASQALEFSSIYEVAPLRFYKPGPDDYELHFRSHVPDLTWCSESDEMVGVCDQISRLLPSGQA